MKNRLNYTAATVLTSPKVIFLLVALAIMGPLLLPGRILALDSPLALNWDTSGYLWGTSDGPQSVFAATYNTAPIAFVLKILGTLLPLEVIEKLWLILLFWLCGIGAFHLPYLHGKGRYYAGVLYTVNPFTYTRFVAGQWGILGSYALIPFAATSFVQMLEEPKPRHAVRTVFFLTAIAFLQVHGLLIVLLAMAILYLSQVAVVPGTLKKSAPMMLLTTLLFLGTNAFWMVRYATAGGGSVNNMPITELRFFAASPPVDVVSLRGFWLKAPYIDISSVIPVWWVFFLPIVGLAVYGAFKSMDTPSVRWLGLAMVFLTLAGILLAVGPGLAVTQGVFNALWEHLPIYRAFRDSHKFVALLALAYAYLGALGLQSLPNPAQQPGAKAKHLVTFASLVALTVPFIYTLPIFGTWGQLQPSSYPQDWLQARSILDEDKSDFNLLVLPWHMYMDFQWLANRSKRLANPAPIFFSQPTLSGDNIEIAMASSESSNQVSKYVEWLLPKGEGVHDFGKLIAPLNAKYVVLLKSADFNAYGFLYKQTDLQLLFEGETIALFRNSHPTARAYPVRDVIPVNSLDQYLETSRGQNPLEHLYVLNPDGGSSVSLSTDRELSTKFSLTQENPVTFRIESTDKGYFVLTLPQHTLRDGWKHQGEPDAMNLRMMPAFQASQGKATITLPRFYSLYLPMYALAGATLATALLIAWGRPYMKKPPFRSKK